MITYNRLPIEHLQKTAMSDQDSILLPSYTFCYLTAGTAQISIHDRSDRYHTGDLFLLPPDTEAIFQVSDKQNAPVVILLGLAASFVQDSLHASVLPVCNSVLSPEQDYLPLIRLILQIVGEGQDQSPAALSIMGNSYLLLNELHKLSDHFIGAAATDKYTDRVQAISSYIDAHYAETLSLSKLAQAFYLTPQYLSSFFKKNFHKNFKTYLNEIRLFYSLRDLKRTDLSINEVALENGFSSVSSYRKNFEAKYNVTPSAYRARSRKLPETQLLKEQQLSLLNGSYSTAPLSVNHRADLEAEPVRSRRADQIINVGAASNLLSSEFRQHLLNHLHSTNSHYIRITDVFSSAFIPMLLPRYEYYYQNMTTVINFLYEHNLLPIIELTRGQFNFPINARYGEDYHVQSSSNRFFHLLEHFLHHILQRMPFSWLSQWKFEIWMKTDETIEDYAERFLHIEQIIHAILPKAAIGGPGYHFSTSALSADKFLLYCRRHAIPLDFFSAYLDLREKSPRTGQVVLSKDPDYLLKQCKKLKQILNLRSPDLPFYITEWTSFYLSGIPIAYTRYQAAFIAKNYLALSQSCDMIGYWLFSDFKYSASFLQKSLFLDGSGILTSTMIPTASYYVFEMFSQLGGRILASGSDYILIQHSENHYQLLSYYYVHPDHYLAPELQAGEGPFEEIPSMFSEAPAISSQFYLYNMEPGTYRIRRQVIDEKSGNYLEILIAQYEHSNVEKEVFLQNARIPDRTLRTYYMNAFVPEVREFFTSITGSTMYLESQLVPQSICLWDIQKQL